VRSLVQLIGDNLQRERPRHLSQPWPSAQLSPGRILCSIQPEPPLFPLILVVTPPPGSHLRKSLTPSSSPVQERVTQPISTSPLWPGVPSPGHLGGPLLCPLYITTIFLGCVWRGGGGNRVIIFQMWSNKCPEQGNHRSTYPLATLLLAQPEDDLPFCGPSPAPHSPKHVYVWICEAEGVDTRCGNQLQCPMSPPQCRRRASPSGTAGYAERGLSGRGGRQPSHTRTQHFPPKRHRASRLKSEDRRRYPRSVSMPLCTNR